MSQGNLAEFFTSTAANETKWYFDPDTDQVVCYCESCSAEARYAKEHPEEFQFAHEDSCPHSDEGRAQRLVEAVANVLHDETDSHVAFSAIVFLSASMCAVAADEVGLPIDALAKRFVSEFEQRVRDIGPVMQNVNSNQNNAA
jgi:hypothetical protein